MKRDEFLILANRELDGARHLFETKNQSYGKDNEVFHNFEEAARRVHGDASYEAMWRVMFTYMDKHMIALAKGIDEREFTERCRDIIVYSLLAIALRQESESVFIYEGESKTEVAP